MNTRQKLARHLAGFNSEDENIKISRSGKGDPESLGRSDSAIARDATMKCYALAPLSDPIEIEKIIAAAIREAKGI